MTRVIDAAQENRCAVILEGLLTTTDADGSPHVAPIGAVLADETTSPAALRLRPFATSTTYHNLKRTAQAVFHVTDDVELIARAAIHRLERPPAVQPASAVEGWILSDACRWYALRVERWDDRRPRAEVEMRVVDSGRLRDFFGLCRASHAVLEAAILATRLGLLPTEAVRADLARLAALVEKTGGPRHRAAWALLDQYVHDAAEEAS